MKTKVIGALARLFLSGCTSRHYSKYVSVEGSASPKVHYSIAQDVAYHLVSQVILSKIRNELLDGARNSNPST
ncbi:MAG: hypothetical protein ACKVQC_03325 [Elusimicrobiota bacterium]